MGLMSAFLLRGAGLVLATQWSVLDACAAEMALTFVEQLVQQGRPPTEALRAAQRRARSMDAELILARCEELAKRFPKDDFPHEAAKVHAQAAHVGFKAGLATLAREHAAASERLLRRVGQDAEADQLAAATRAAANLPRENYRVRSFDHPLFWSAFHLVGRVT
jgi:CHAT domain-containing protein